jgi:predicted ATP-dependent serine protease
VREHNLAIRFEKKRKQIEKYAFNSVFKITSGDIHVTYKTMLLGDMGVGKSCVLLRYTVMIYIFLNFRQISTKQIYLQSD